jgi:hypothetical protein
LGVGSTAELANDLIIALERPKIGARCSIAHTVWSARSMPRGGDCRCDA